MNERCPACGGVRVPTGVVYVGDWTVCHCSVNIASGTTIIRPFVLGLLQVESTYGTRRVRPDWENFTSGYGTYFAAPYRTLDDLIAELPRPSYAEQRADAIIAAWQSSGEVKIETLRTLIIEAIEEEE